MRYIMLFLAAGVALGACKKNVDGPAENYTQAYVYDSLDKNGIAAIQALANLYSEMPTGFNRIGGDLLDAATDDAMPSRYGTTIQTLIDANTTSGNQPDGQWSKYYGAIRKVNLFLQNVGAVPKPEVPGWKAEARFLRALFYFELLKRYGGVPIVKDTVYSSEGTINIARNSFDECVNYIVSECDATKALLRQEPVSNTDFGRASRGAALALKSRVLLYAASPLYNGGVPAGASPAQAALMGYPSYDANRWNAAANAANDFLAINSYPLEATYNNVFLNRKNNEVVLSFLRNTTTDIETTNGPVGYPQGATGMGQTSPTQELVDAFPMSNGRAITDPASGYVATNPYNNRDPRLANTVLRNGSQWLNRNVETFEGGLDKPNTSNVQTRTGYYLRKFMGNFATATQYTAQNHNFVIFRSAEMMLNYAEALNEFSGPTTNVVTQVINIRKRAGIAAGTDNRYGIPAGITQSQMRDLIRNERRIEMAYEEQRYWDLRRWKAAETVLNSDLHGTRITKDQAGNFSYQNFTAGKIRFNASRMYYYAIPYSEIIANPALIQNAGW